MRSIFWRIFLSFWLAMALIVISAVLISFQLAAERAADFHRARPAKLIFQASEVLRHSGRNGLQAWLKRQNSPRSTIKLFIIDGSGKDLLGRPLPPRFERHLHWLHELRRGRLPPNYRPPRPEPILVGAHGEQYAILMLPRRPGIFGILGIPAAGGTVLLTALLISTIICLLLARFVSAPVRRLQAATRALAAGDLSVRVGGSLGRRRDELAVLGRDFDAMAERIQQLLNSHRELIRNISHELRSPLARLSVALGLARHHASGATRELDRIEREAERLEGLIADLLKLSRLEQQRGELHIERTDLSALLDAVVADARYEAESSQRRIEWTQPPTLEMDADPDLLHSAVENVIRNAVKYTAEGTAVHIVLERDRERSGWIRIVVRDHGPGVPDGLLQKIFEPFFRVAEARDRDSGGEGIGLAITARIVALHGGTVSAANAEDGGLRLTIALPCAVAAAASGVQ